MNSESHLENYRLIEHHEKMNALALEHDFMIFSMLKPKLTTDGNMYCVLYGENIQEGIAGFGKTPRDAIRNFNAEFEKEKFRINLRPIDHPTNDDSFSGF